MTSTDSAIPAAVEASVALHSRDCSDLDLCPQSDAPQRARLPGLRSLAPRADGKNPARRESDV